MTYYAGLFLFYWLILDSNRITGQLHEQYVGCFVGNGKNSEWETVLKDAHDLTIEKCIQKCHNESNTTMTFAALQNGKRCTCRNGYGQRLNDRNCDLNCSGNQLQFCGGKGYEQFYSLYTVCSVGHFGTKCGQLCHCKKHLPCDRNTGLCPNGCEEKWTGISCNISDISKQYIGCYGDGPPNGRQVMDAKNPGGLTGGTKPKANSIEFCIEICSKEKYTYAGMQYAYDCSCGEKYDIYGNMTNQGKEVNCSSPCPANTSQMCGGDYANSVYYVCPIGFYGRNCSKRCNCANEGPCRFNGSCLTSALNFCKPGWTGSACHIRDCGINNGGCDSDEKCEILDLGFANMSVCRCKDGSYRNNNTCKQTSLHYVGCYKGSTAQYVAPELPTTEALTIEICMQKCRQMNKPYTIIQGGVTCLCGDGYGDVLPDSDCQVPCAGNKQQYCGGRSTADRTPIYVVYTDIDECQSCASLCDPISVYCFNSIGNYSCECRGGFQLKFGKRVDYISAQTIGIILGAFLAISLLINGLLLFSRINSRKSRKPETDKSLEQPEIKRGSMKAPDQHEINCYEVLEAVGQSSIYEEINMEQCQRGLKPTSAYTKLLQEKDLKQDV